MRCFLVPFLCVLALIALFLKLPEISYFTCALCTAKEPYLPLIGALYFSLLFSIALLFPRFPSSDVAKGGLFWAISLFLLLSYSDLPKICTPCLIGHACNIAIFTLWVFSKRPNTPSTDVQLKIYLTILLPIAVVALFSALNLTAGVYGMGVDRGFSASKYSRKDKVPEFSYSSTISHTAASPLKKTILNFVAPNCPYCKEQAAVLEELMPELKRASWEYVLVDTSSAQGEDLRRLFGIRGYPTLFVIEDDGVIEELLPGVPEGLKETLQKMLDYDG